MSSKNVEGVAISYYVTKNRLYADIFFTNDKGKTISKRLANVKIGGKDESADSAGSATPAATPKKKDPPKSKVDKVLKSKEADDPVDDAFKETVTAPAAEAPAEPPAEPTVATEPVAPVEGGETPPAADITPEEIEEEANTTESYFGIISKILKSREEAQAAVSEIEDNQIDEVVGDDEGTPVDDTPPEGGETPPVEEEPTEEEKAIESFIQSLE
jgi:hypothetical protein